MKRRDFAFLGCALIVAGPGLAQDLPADAVKLTAAQIDTLLSGNTAVGTWSGNGYRQYFDASGATLYLAEGAPPDRGKWRINAETDQYESWWERSNWAGYTIVMTNEGYAWLNRGALEPFELLAGDRLGG